jgi:ribonuclease D
VANHTPVLIDQAAAATRTLTDISASRELALDTEGASFHRFVDRVYLLQLSTRQQTAIIDPLSVPADALAPLAAQLENPSVEVVLHDADYDLRLLHQDYGWHVRRIFDTRVASQLLGLKSFGLSALLERYFGVTLDKKHQRADWSMRPLPQDMLDYAAQDTAYLLDLRDRLSDELKKLGRSEWAREEFDRLEGIRWENEDATLGFLRIKGARDLSRRELAVLRELANWRDTIARDLDRATFRVIGNEQLLELSRVQPHTREDLARVKGISRGLLENRSAEMIGAIRRGLEVPEADLPRFPKAPRWDKDPGFDERVNALRNVREQIAHKLDMDPGVLAPRERLEAVARRNPQSSEELGEVQQLRRWQAEVLGEEFLRALRKLKKRST